MPRERTIQAWNELDDPARVAVIACANADAPHPYLTSIEAAAEHEALFDGGVLAVTDGERCDGVAGLILRNLPSTGELFLVGLRGTPEATGLLVARSVAEAMHRGARTIRAGTPSAEDTSARTLVGAGFTEVDRAEILALRGPGFGLDDALELRPLTREEAADWAELFVRAFRGTPNAAVVGAQDVLASLDRGVVMGFATHEGRPVGVYELEVRGDHGWVDGIALLPAARGRGLGRRLLTAAVRLLRERGPDEIRMMVMATNTTAMALYRSAGFETIELRSVWYELTL
ncbi:MAG: GNAT family N-acetyltransferase [Alphaproteobacteria bacterium]|nr:GNAT family N-acetyltransferase [Alphaproteobacteria bacterium]